MVKKRLLEDTSLSSRNNFNHDHICAFLDLSLVTTYFQYSEVFYRQKRGYARWSLVLPMVANLYMEEVENRTLVTFAGTAPSHWFRYVDNTRVKNRAREVEAFMEHKNAVDNIFKFTQEEVRGCSLPFLDCAVHTEEDRSLDIEVYKTYSHRSILAV